MRRDVLFKTGRKIVEDANGVGFLTGVHLGQTLIYEPLHDVRADKTGAACYEVGSHKIKEKGVKD